MRANDLAEAIIARKPGMGAVKLQKILYYTHAWHLAVTGEPLITDQPFRAYDMGPVVDDVWHKRQDPQARRTAPNPPVLDATASQIADMVLAQYGRLTGHTLSELTHEEEPWKEARGGLPRGEKCRTPLSNDTTIRYFRNKRLCGHTAEELASLGFNSPASVDEETDADDLWDSVMSVPPEFDEHAVSLSRAEDLSEIDYTGLGRRSGTGGTL